MISEGAFQPNYSILKNSYGHTINNPVDQFTSCSNRAVLSRTLNRKRSNLAVSICTRVHEGLVPIFQTYFSWYKFATFLISPEKQMVTCSTNVVQVAPNMLNILESNITSANSLPFSLMIFTSQLHNSRAVLEWKIQFKVIVSSNKPIAFTFHTSCKQRLI